MIDFISFPIEEDLPLILVANKTDLEEERVIEMTESKEKAEELGSLYFESGNHNRPEFFALLERVITDMLASQGFKV